MNRFALMAACALSLGLGSGCEKAEEESPFVPTSLALESAATEFKVGTTVQLRAVAKGNDGREQEVSTDVTFTSSNDLVATVDEAGLVNVLAGGPVAFTAKSGEFEAVLEARSRCDFPRYTKEIGYGRTMPPLSWPAKWPDGTDFDFDLANVFCDLDWKETQTVTFVLSAGWCGPCTLYAQRLENEVANLSKLGMQVVIVEVQDTDGSPAGLAFAYKHLKSITKNIPGIAIGDLDTRPVASYFEDSGYIEAFPSVFVVRTADMKIIADQKRADIYLPLAKIAKDPDADWSKSGNPVFVDNCGPDDEEDSEPNNLPNQAAPLAPGTHKGGICTDGPDLYTIDIQGAWTLQLDFDNGLGDLDVFVWDAERNEAAMIDGQLVGSSNGTGTEKFNFQGPAMIGVMPFHAASAPYTLTLTGN